MSIPNFIRQTLADLQAKGLYRRLVEIGSAVGPRVTIAGRTALVFASNNYLGLAGDPRVREAACRAIDRWGWGAGASRAVAGHTEAHAALEADLAAFKHTQAALVFPTGYMTNLGVISSLAGHDDLAIMDRANHASLYDGVRLAGAEMDRYPQADAAAAASLFEKHRGRPGRRLLITDTVFSMDGRTAPLADLVDLARREGAMLVVDEAHATGVLGPTGAGLAEELGLGIAGSGSSLSPCGRGDGGEGDARDGITASVGTLSKALGGLGGFVAASREVCELLINRARPFLYTTALPAAACEAARAALAIVRTEPERRRRLRASAARLRTMLRERGFDLGPKQADLDTPIIPVLVGAPERALALAGALLEGGIFCPAIRPPTVPPGASRLRVSLTSEHTDEDLARLVEALVAAQKSTK